MYRGEGHLTADDAERFADGVMSDPELCEADSHQANCDECHALVNAQMELAQTRRETIAAEMGDTQFDYPDDSFPPDDEEDRRIREEVRREERDNEEDLRRD